MSSRKKQSGKQPKAKQEDGLCDNDLKSETKIEDQFVRQAFYIKKRDWEALKQLPPSPQAGGKGSASWHLREAIKLYLQVQKVDS